MTWYMSTQPAPMPTAEEAEEEEEERTRVASRVSAPCSAEQDREGASLRIRSD